MFIFILKVVGAHCKWLGKKIKGSKEENKNQPYNPTSQKYSLVTFGTFFLPRISSSLSLFLSPDIYLCHLCHVDDISTCPYMYILYLYNLIGVLLNPAFSSSFKCVIKQCPIALNSLIKHPLRRLPQRMSHSFKTIALLAQRLAYFQC